MEGTSLLVFDPSFSLVCLLKIFYNIFRMREIITGILYVFSDGNGEEESTEAEHC